MSSQQSTQAARQALRHQLLAMRKRFSSAKLDEAAIQLAHHLRCMPELHTATTVASYLDVNGEAPTYAFNQWIIAQTTKQLVLPVLHPFATGHLLFLRQTAATQWRYNVYSIREPMLDVTKVMPLHQLQVMIVPVVGFDAQGRRLGMGGGYYDRTLARWQQGEYPNLLPIGLAHDEQQVDRIPVEAWDVPLPVIVTPSRILRIRDGIGERTK